MKIVTNPRKSAYLIRIDDQNSSRKRISSLTLLNVQRISFSGHSSRCDARIIPFHGSRDFHSFRHARSSDLNCRGGSGVGVFQGYVNGTRIFPPSNVPLFFHRQASYARYDDIEIIIKSSFRDLVSYVRKISALEQPWPFSSLPRPRS